MLHRLIIAGYRSVRDLHVELDQVTVFVGANGSGKSNIYRAMHLLGEAANGRLSQALAMEGGLQSALSASDSPTACRKLELCCRIDDWQYELEVGLPPTGPTTAFRLDPYVKVERLETEIDERKLTFLERRNVRAKVLDANGRMADFPHELHSGEATLGQIHDPHQFPEFAALRQRVQGWRFYHQFRTDEGSPLRQPQIGVFSPVLAHDGVNLAAALQTILEHGVGVGGLLAQQWLDRALPGVELQVAHDDRAMFEVMLHVPNMNRMLRAAELSDGQLRLLCLLAALASPRPPDLLVFNEPESSLHPSVLPTLADLIGAASRACQIVVTTHDHVFAERIADATGHAPREIELRNGETRIVGRGRYE